MSASGPLIFEPIPMERVWGGRRLEKLLGKNLPAGVPVGESWEIVDRADAQSVVHSGPLGGTTLHGLWTGYREEIFGPDYAGHASERFPLLFKVLDARDRLSVQVHPPAHVAGALGGEPKTEMWYFMESLAGASIFAGLRRGVTRADFEAALASGRVDGLLHQIPVDAGDSIFIPSGRIHAIGEGCLIVEVQQNSDTTYRVFDWNRVGLDGKPRALHIAESMESIDFSDYEPSLADPTTGVAAACEHFVVEVWDLEEGVAREALDKPAFAVFTVTAGRVACGDTVMDAGAFFLVPASGAATTVKPVAGPATVLRTTLPLK